MRYSPNQVATIMAQLGLTRANRGQAGQHSTSSVISHHGANDGARSHTRAGRHTATETYSNVYDEAEFCNVTGMPPTPPLTTATSLAAKSQLVNELVLGDAEVIQFGLVFATVLPKHIPEGQINNTLQNRQNPYHIRLWLVARKFLDCCFCIRIRTYQGNGIKHLKADMMIQTLLGDERLRALQQEGVQKDIDAHTIIYPKEARSATLDPAEPRMKKQSLSVVLSPGIGHEVIDRMSRACFIRPYRIEYGEQVARIGTLDKVSQACLERYTAEMFGDSC